MTVITPEALRKLKDSLYDGASQDGTISAIANICRSLGEKVNSGWGPKYKLLHKNLRVYVDDYGGYATVHNSDGKLLMSTHNERLFTPGEWSNTLLKLRESSDDITASIHRHHNKVELQKLLDELNLQVKE